MKMINPILLNFSFSNHAWSSVLLFSLLFPISVLFVQLVWTCYNFYQSTPTKLAGENYFFHGGQVRLLFVCNFSFKSCYLSTMLLIYYCRTWVLALHGIYWDLRLLSHLCTYGVSLGTKHTKNGVGTYFKHLKRILVSILVMLDWRM